MLIQLKKFGATLTSREDGREAWAAIQPLLKKLNDAEAVQIDFTGVNTFSPSWGDEFLAPFFKKFKNRLTLLNSENASVKATLAMLESGWKS